MPTIVSLVARVGWMRGRPEKARWTSTFVSVRPRRMRYVSPEPHRLKESYEPHLRNK